MRTESALSTLDYFLYFMQLDELLSFLKKITLSSSTILQKHFPIFKKKTEKHVWLLENKKDVFQKYLLIVFIYLFLDFLKE